jgi:hypothetical protein
MRGPRKATMKNGVFWAAPAEKLKAGSVDSLFVLRREIQFRVWSLQFSSVNEMQCRGTVVNQENRFF